MRTNILSVEMHWSKVHSFAIHFCLFQAGHAQYANNFYVPYSGT